MVAHAEHNPHDPDLVVHEQTYHVFNVLVRWSTVVLAALISGLTLWFATPAGVWGGLIVGAVVFALGYQFVVRHEEQQPLDLWVEGR